VKLTPPGLTHIYKLAKTFPLQTHSTFLLTEHKICQSSQLWLFILKRKK